MAQLTDIEGIGDTYGQKLTDAGISNIDQLLEAGCTKAGRAKLSEQTGVSEKIILNWINRADLSRVKGVSTQYADLLEAAGVDTVPELAQRNAENLHAAMDACNAEKKLVRQMPAVTQVQSWVEQAKELPRKVTH